MWIIISRLQHELIESKKCFLTRFFLLVCSYYFVWLLVSFAPRIFHVRPDLDLEGPDLANLALTTSLIFLGGHDFLFLFISLTKCFDCKKRSKSFLNHWYQTLEFYVLALWVVYNFKKPPLRATDINSVKTCFNALNQINLCSCVVLYRFITQNSVVVMLL